MMRAMPRFAANLSMLFTELPMLQRFAAAASAGFDAVELQFPYEWPAEALREALQEAGLPLVLHNLPAGDWAAGERGIACLPGREAEFRAGVDRALAYAQALGAPRLNCLAGIAPAGADPALLRATMLGNLRHASARLAEAGLELLLEPINQRDVPGFWLHRSGQALELLDELGAANAKLQYDLYHAQRSEGELVGTLRRHLGRIGHIQIADNPGRHEPGSGEIAFDFIFDELDRLGYAGHVGCEYLPAAGTDAGLGWLREARCRLPGT